MKAALFYGGQDIRVEEVPAPRPGPGEVLIAVRAAGVCGSDLHRYRGHDPWVSGGAVGGGPRRAGHELAGVVAELGPGVEGLAVGQAVAVEPMQLAGCGRCPACRRGDANVCPQRGMFGGRRRVSAAFSEFDVARVDHVYPVRDGLPLTLAALADVYACAVHALHRTPIAPQDTVLVVGAGPVGLALGQASRLAGAGRVLLAGRRAAPLETALAIGAADQTIVAGPAIGLGNLVREANGGQGADVVFEAVGGTSDEPLRQAVDALAGGGVLCVLGAYVGDVAWPYRQANDKEITVRWSNGYACWNGCREFQIALDWLAARRVTAAPLVTHRYPLAQIAEAFRVADQRTTTQAIKVLVEP